MTLCTNKCLNNWARGVSLQFFRHKLDLNDDIVGTCEALILGSTRLGVRMQWNTLGTYIAVVVYVKLSWDRECPLQWTRQQAEVGSSIVVSKWIPIVCIYEIGSWFSWQTISRSCSYLHISINIALNSWNFPQRQLNIVGRSFANNCPFLGLGTIPQHFLLEKSVWVFWYPRGFKLVVSGNKSFPRCLLYVNL